MIQKTSKPIDVQRLQRMGVLPLSGVGRAAHERRCKRCGSRIVVGLDSDMCAAEVRCDPYALTVVGELHALIDGLSTYDIRWRATRFELDYRTSFEIASCPPGSRRRVDVLAEHRCGRRQESVATAQRTARAWQTPSPSTEPPF